MDHHAKQSGGSPPARGPRGDGGRRVRRAAAAGRLARPEHARRRRALRAKPIGGRCPAGFGADSAGIHGFHLEGVHAGDGRGRTGRRCRVGVGSIRNPASARSRPSSPPPGPKAKARRRNFTSLLARRACPTAPASAHRKSKWSNPSAARSASFARASALDTPGHNSRSGFPA